MFKNNPFIVAEMSCNHLGDYEKAKAIIRAAQWAGADAVKFQTYTPNLIAADVQIVSGPWAGRSYRELYKEAQTPWHWHGPLFDYVRKCGMVPFSAPFSVQDVGLLKQVNCPIYKIASPEITHRRLIEAAAGTGKPLIISTGMASIREIHGAYQYAVAAGATDITFLHCISSYPAPTDDFNMETLTALIKLGYKVGLSDHSKHHIAAVMAVALGATVIEKHLCLDRNFGGHDAAFSLEPDEFKHMVWALRQAAAARGQVTYGCRESEKNSYQYRRSLWFVRDMSPGQPISEKDLGVLRPNYGVAPDQLCDIIGKRVKAAVAANTPVTMELLE